MTLRFWQPLPDPRIVALREAYDEAKLCMRYHIQQLEAQNKDLTAKLLELLEPGITARLTPRAPRPVRVEEQPTPASLAAARVRHVVPLPGYDPPDEGEAG